MSRSGPTHTPAGAAPEGRGESIADAAPAPRGAVAVVVSRYNGSITGKLLEGALAAYREAGGDPAAVAVVDAPGAYELVALSNAAARTGRFAGVVALGCIIRGDTDHDRYIASAVATGLAQVTVETGVPVAFGVLTVNTTRQARERAGGVHGNKGAEAMVALLNTIDAIRSLERGDAAQIAGGVALPDKAAGNGRGVVRNGRAKAAGGRR